MFFAQITANGSNGCARELPTSCVHAAMTFWYSSKSAVAISSLENARAFHMVSLLISLEFPHPRCLTVLDIPTKRRYESWSCYASSSMTKMAGHMHQMLCHVPRRHHPSSRDLGFEL